MWSGSETFLNGQKYLQAKRARLDEEVIDSPVAMGPMPAPIPVCEGSIVLDIYFLSDNNKLFSLIF